MASLIEQAENGTLTLTWRAVGDKKMCDHPQGGCASRHGKGAFTDESITLQEWEAMGLPGTGWSACRGNCRCVLLPDNIFDVGDFDAEFPEPFEIGPVIDEVNVADPIEAARIAMNTRLMEEYRAGQRVIYRGPIRQLNGMSGVVRPGPDPVDGLWIDFDFPLQGFPETAAIRIFDFTELVTIVGDG